MFAVKNHVYFIFYRWYPPLKGSDAIVKEIWQTTYNDDHSFIYILVITDENLLHKTCQTRLTEKIMRGDWYVHIKRFVGSHKM